MRDGRLVKLELPDTVDATVTAGTLFVRLREDWMPAARNTGGPAPGHRLEKFLAGGTGFDVLFTPSPRVPSVLRADEVRRAPESPRQVSSRLVEMRRADGR